MLIHVLTMPKNQIGIKKNIVSVTEATKRMCRKNVNVNVYFNSNAFALNYTFLASLYISLHETWLTRAQRVIWASWNQLLCSQMFRLFSRREYAERAREYTLVIQRVRFCVKKISNEKRRNTIKCIQYVGN